MQTRILVKEVNWLGDVVMSLPALRAVRHAFPQAHLSILVKRELASFFNGAGWIDEVIPYSYRKGFFQRWTDRQKVITEIRARRFDLAILFPNSLDAALWPWLAGVPQRAGFARNARGFILTHTVKPSREILEVHQVNYYLKMLDLTLGIKGSPENCTPDISSADQEKMRGFLSSRRKRQGPLVAMAVAAAYGPAKEWPAASYAQLIDLLAERHGAECVLVGAPSERKKSEEVLALSRTGGVQAAGETSVGEALALLSLCAGFAGNDSGSMHAAGALGKPTAGIFGSTRADRTAPLGPHTRVLFKPIACSPCLRRTCRYGHYDCLKQIQPADVLEALVQLGAFQ